MSLFQKLFSRSVPSRRWDEPGISPAERRYRARMQASQTPQNTQPVNDLPDRRISRNEWCKETFGSLATAPETWRKGRI